MPQNLHVHLLPTLFQPEEVKDQTVVICDILRASTTITTSLANGCEGVSPCGSIEQALELRKQFPVGQCLLGGERGGVQIDGFDLSNSPADYAVSIVRGKRIGFTTTNGTKALLHSGQAANIVIGAFVNLTAVVQYLQSVKNDIHIVCAGTNGRISSEDVLFAGAVVHQLCQTGAVVHQQQLSDEVAANDSATIAMGFWRDSCPALHSQSIEQGLKRSTGGQNLLRLGYDSDITLAAAVDSVPVVGMLQSDQVIRLIR